MGKHGDKGAGLELDDDAVSTVEEEEAAAEGNGHMVWKISVAVEKGSDGRSLSSLTDMVRPSG